MKSWVTGVYGRKIIRWKNSHFGAGSQSKCWKKAKVFHSWGRPHWLAGSCGGEHGPPEMGPGPSFSQAVSSASLSSDHLASSVSNTKERPEPWVGTFITVNHADKILFSDKLWWTGSLEIKELAAWPTSHSLPKISAFLLLYKLLGKTKHTHRPIRKYICFIISKFLFVQK